MRHCRGGHICDLNLYTRETNTLVTAFYGSFLKYTFVYSSRISHSTQPKIVNPTSFWHLQIGSCKNVTVMSLRSNKLEFLPEEIGQMQRLRVLNLSDNRYVNYLIKVNYGARRGGTHLSSQRSAWSI